MNDEELLQATLALENLQCGPQPKEQPHPGLKPGHAYVNIMQKRNKRLTNNQARLKMKKMIKKSSTHPT